MKIAVLGAGAFGTALAMSFARGGCDVTLVGRSTAKVEAFNRARENTSHLPGCRFPDALAVTSIVPGDADCLLLAIPMQSLGDALSEGGATLRDRPLVACCKGLSLQTGEGSSAILAQYTETAAVLTGPSFASDIAVGLPTALTLACADDTWGQKLQHALVAPNLRLYRTTDVIGAELGGALKNVFAIGCGVVMGAGLGASARAALLTRGFAEMQRFTEICGAETRTLYGLAGLGDLTLTCTSPLSRNYRFGEALGAGHPFDDEVTVEGRATALALAERATSLGIDMPISQAIAGLLDGRLDVSQAMTTLLSRPMKEE